MRSPGQAIESEHVAAHYDRLDGLYRKTWGDHLHHGLWQAGGESVQEAVENLIDFAVEPMGIREGNCICDVGCGYGATAEFLEQHYEIRTIGITNSPVQYQVAQTRCENRSAIDVRLHDWVENDLPSASCDGVLSIECLAHVADKPAFFREVGRVLKPGRRAVILDWMSAGNPASWEKQFLLEPICRAGSLAGLGNEAHYAELVASAGLRVISCEDLTTRVRKTWSVLAKRIGQRSLSDPELWRFAVARPVTSVRLALSIPCLLAAYRVGALRYGRLVVERPVT